MADIEASVEKFKNTNRRRAKNVILFIGDSMGLTTVTAGRIFKAQKEDSSATGEEYRTALDRMPHTGLLKTYGGYQLLYFLILCLQSINRLQIHSISFN